MSLHLIRSITDTVSSRLGLDIGYLFKNGNWVTFRFLVATITGFFVSLTFARFSEKELLGQYQLILSLISVVSVFSLLGLNASALEAVTHGREAAVFRASKNIFKASLFGALIIVVAGVYVAFFRQEQIELGIPLLIAGLLFPLFYATTSWSAYYEGNLLFRESSLRMIAQNLAVAAVLIGAIFAKLNLTLLVVAYLLTTILFQGWYLNTIWKKLSNTSDNELDFRFGAAVSFQKFVSGLSTNIPPIALSFYFGVELLAVYYIAFYAVGALTAFLNNLMALYLPILFKRTRLNHRGILVNSFLSGIVILFIFLIFLKLLFLPIYGYPYAESLRLAYFLSPLLVLAPFHTYLVSYFSTRRQNSFLIGIFTISNVLGLLVLYLSHRHGFIPSTASYLITLEFTTVIPLFAAYLRAHVRREVVKNELGNRDKY